jgi:integrase
MCAQSLLLKRKPKTNVSLAYPRVSAFLNSIKKRSLKTSRSYSSALIHLDNFIKKQYPNDSYNSDNIVDAMVENKINVYELLDSFVSYIQSVKVGISSKSIVAYMAGLRSYLGYHDIDIIPTRFKKKVFVPVVYREDEEPIDSSDIRKLLLSCNSKRLKPYLLVLASGGTRTVEALAIRNKDIDFSQSPTKVHIRKEYTKTKVARDIYISDEATYHLKQWLDWKYKNPEQPRAFDNNDLVFTVYRSANIPESLYQQICREFQRLLKAVDMDEKILVSIRGIK